MSEGIDILIRNGKIYDGRGGEPFVGDIGVTDDRIVAVSRRQGELGGGAERTIEAGGLSVAPGFIDSHAHSEFTLLADGRAEGKIFQGVTTEISGNCGLSAAPLYGEAREHREKDLKELGIEARWSTLAEYLHLLESEGFALNFATLAGHGNIRASVMGYSDRSPDSSETERMKALLRDAVQEGALGLSTGLIYPPGVYAETEEIIGLARCIRERIYTSHMRSESDGLIEAIKETIRIGKESGIAVHISHIKTGGKSNWPRIDGAIAEMEEARSGGIRLTCDRYPYTAASTDLDALLPSWTYEGGAEEELKRLRGSETRDKIRNEILSRHSDNDYWGGIIISSLNSEKNKWMEGKDLASISQGLGRNPVDFLLDILAEEKLRIGAIFHTMNEENLVRFLKMPYLMIGSDSSARSYDGPTQKGKPHPRGFGTFPRFLGRYARDIGLMRIAEAVHKATMLPADTFGLKGRGRIAEGLYADIVVFDEERVVDTATFDDPYRKPEGIYYVLVNGSPAVWEGSFTGIMAGRVLRNGG